MAVTWNNEYYIALEGKDLQANAMAVDNSGTYVLLAGYVNDTEYFKNVIFHNNPSRMCNKIV
ncbi:hypothetical protein BDFB_003476 [Asbolus verrucosus]|uniref:Uncharacterized protein n=1 Tax=Asbolus verrucosus TaxID=1661398 RepID=A0A482V963_ASBVE|nr:hypothetical protein BDFB_003476 [Asbolus verrucosus]